MLDPGTVLDGKYEIIKVLGRGGMGTVYLSQNKRLGNMWAIKEVKNELKSQVDFLAEPNLLKNLSHPGIPRVVDIFYHNENLYIVEDYIEGDSLDKYVEESGKLSSESTAEIALELSSIIAYLHGLKPPIIYRDLKPSNIMITKSGRVMLVDFGISRTYKKSQEKDTVFMGSRGFAAPEQYGMAQSDERTDIYGLGSVMYYMALGKAPNNLSEPLKDDVYKKEEIHEDLRKAIQRAMQIEPDNRYSKVQALRNELFSYLDRNNKYKTMMLNGFKENEPDKTIKLKESKASEDTEKTRLIGKQEPPLEADFDKTMLMNEAPKMAEEIDKTMLMEEAHQNAAGIDKTMLMGEPPKSKESIDKTVLMNDVSGSASKKKEILTSTKKAAKGKKKAVALAILCVLLIAWGMHYILGEKGSAASNSAVNQSTPIDNSSDNKVNQNTSPQKASTPPVKDTVIEGTVDSHNPISEQTSGEDGGPGNGKHKGKDKHKSNNDGQVQEIAFDINPSAINKKYNNEFVISAKILELKNGYTILYCDIQNNTGSNISIDSSSIYLNDNQGKSIQEDRGISEDLSSITAGSKLQNVPIAFDNSSITSNRIVLKAVSTGDGLSGSGAVNLIVNIK